jgi:4-hydroxybenzoate polyprenyltransferase
MAYNLNLLLYPLSLLLLFLIIVLANDKKTIELLKNCRPPQMVYHAGLFFIGMGLGYLAYPGNFSINLASLSAAISILASVWLSWMASVVLNDIHDYEIDAISNPNRPLQKKIVSIDEYRQYGIFLFILAILGGLTVGFKFAGLLFIYQLLAYSYSAKPFRIKRFPLAATFLDATASIIILFLGFLLFSGDQNIIGLSWRIILLILIAFTLSLPLKDFKDIEGDKKYGVWTIPVLFGESNARLIVATGIFISFILSVLFLNEPRLFFWALLFGTLSFLSVATLKTKPRQLPWRVMELVFIYGLILVKIVFLR